MRIFCFLVCILTSFLLSAQNNKEEGEKEIRSYKSILDDKKLNETEKTDSLFKVIQRSYQKDPANSEYLAQCLYEYCLDKKSKKGIVRSLVVFGKIQSYTGKFRDSDTSYRAAIKLLEHMPKSEIPDDKVKVSILISLMENAMNLGDNNMGNEYAQKVMKELNDMDQESEEVLSSKVQLHQKIALGLSNRSLLDSSLIHFDIAIRNAKKMEDDSHLSRCYLNIGGVYLGKREYLKAFEYWLKCKKIAVENNDLRMHSTVTVNLAQTYLNLGDTKDALKLYKEYLNYSKQTGNLFDLSLAHVNLAMVYFIKNDFDKAESHYNELDKLGKNIDLGSMNFTIYLGRGAIAMNQNKYTIAEKFFTKAEKLVGFNQNSQQKSQLFMNWGFLKFAQKKYAKALDYVKRCRQLEVEMGTYDLRAMASKLAYDIYIELGKTDEALKMLQFYNEERDTLIQRDERSKIITLDLKTNFQLKQQKDSIDFANEFAIQSAQSRAKDETLKRKNSELEVKRNQQYLLFGGIGFLGLFLLFLYNRFRVTNRQNKIIEKQKDKNLYLSQKILEQDQQLILGETAKTVAHELNSPLGAIKAGAEGLHYLMEELVNNLLPASSKEDLDLASHLSSQQETGTFVGMKQKQEKANNIQKKLSEKFGLESASSGEIASELSELHVFNPDEKIINFLVSCQDRQPIYKLAKCIGQIKMISQTTISATNKSADVVSSVREALDFQSAEDLEDVRLDESISSVVTIIESNINEKGIFKHEIDPEVYLRSVNEFKIFQLWYNLIIFIVEEAEESMEIKVNASENETSTQVRFSLNQAIQNKTLNEHHYKIIMDAKRDSNDLRMGIVKYLLSENNIELQSEISKDKTLFTIDFPSIHKSS